MQPSIAPRLLTPSGARLANLATLAAGAGALALATTGWAAAQGRAQTKLDQFPTTQSPRLSATAIDGALARKIDIGVGKSIVVELPRDAKEVFVSNPSVANAVVRSARQLFLIGISAGSATVFAMDADGRQIAAFEIVAGREIDVLRQLLRTALPTSRIDVQSVAETIVLTGEVDTVLEAQKAIDIARGFIGYTFVGPSGAPTGGTVTGGTVIEGRVVNSMVVRARDQVMLKVTVSEVQRTVLKQLGVDINGGWEIAGKTLAFRNLPPLTGSSQNIGPSQGIGAAFGNAFPNNRDINVRAMERLGVLRTLAEPTLTAVSGETATFFAGGEIPVPGTATCPTGRSQSPNNVRSECDVQNDFRRYGVQLIFTPVVLSEGRISMRVSTDVTDVDYDRGATIAGAANIPAFRVRRQETTIELPSGGSLVTAGLIQQTNRQVINGLPGLMNIPILGTLFRSRDYQRQETELMIIVTPYIAKPVSAKALSRPDDGFIDASDPTANLMGRFNRIYGVAGAALPPQAYKGKFGFIHD